MLVHVQVVIWQENMEADDGAGPRGGIRLNPTVPGTCPGKRPDVTGIKTTHTPCQTVGRMDGWRESRGAIKTKKKKTGVGKGNNERQSLMGKGKKRGEYIYKKKKNEGNGTKPERKTYRKDV